jgi:hypothetical protein
MKFKLTRTTGYGEKPLRSNKVNKVMVEHWMIRTCTEETFNLKFGTREGLWRSKGTNHKKTHNGEWIMRRENDVEVWGIEINTIEELIDFAKKNGELVFKFEENHNIPSIEIYDGYRE